jgi:hypothetical protein
MGVGYNSQQTRRAYMEFKDKSAADAAYESSALWAEEKKQ